MVSKTRSKPAGGSEALKKALKELFGCDTPGRRPQTTAPLQLSGAGCSTSVHEGKLWMRACATRKIKMFPLRTSKVKNEDFHIMTSAFRRG